MEKREQQSSSKRAKVEGPGGRQDAEGGAAANVAAGAMVPTTEAAAARAPALTVLMDMDTLHCPRCNYPFKTPIFQFQCEAGHLACSKCHAELRKDVCYRCGHVGAYVRCVPLENVVGRVRVLCPYKMFGCDTYVIYNGAEAHQRRCPFAPCGCPERGCPFQGTPAALRAHVSAGEHPSSGYVVAFRYGVEWSLAMDAAAAKQQQQWKVLLGQEDGSVFLASLGAVGAGVTVTVVCARANGGGAPAAMQYACNVAMDIAAGGGNNKGVSAVMAWKELCSCALIVGGGAPAPDDGVFFGVNAERLAAGTVSLKICIHPIQVPAISAARAAAAPMSPPAVPVRSNRRPK